MRGLRAISSALRDVLRGIANRVRAFFSGVRDGLAEGRSRARGGEVGTHDDPALRYALATCFEPGCDWAVLVSVESRYGIAATREEHVRRAHLGTKQDPLF